MVGASVGPQPWTVGRLATTVVGVGIAALGLFLVVWGIAMMAATWTSAAAVILLPVGLAFALVGILLVFVGGTLAGIPWFVRVLRRRRHPVH